MNDLDLIKGFRADVPEPDPERAAAAWAGVASRLGTPTLAPLTVRARRRRRWTVSLGMAAAAVILAIAVPAVLPANGPGGARSAEAARELRRLATVAADRPAQPAPAPGQYVYTRSRSFQSSVYVLGDGRPNVVYTRSSTREAWIGTDGSGRLVTADEPPAFSSPADRARWVAAGSPALGAGDAADERFGPGGLHYLDLADLPTDPAELQAVIEKRQIVGGPDGDWETFAIVGDLLRETSASPALRAALYEVAANLPGVEFVGSVRDPIGRSGVAVAYTRPDGIRHELIFDRDTAELLAESEVATKEGPVTPDSGTGAGTIYAWAPPGSTLSSAVYLASGVVDSPDARLA